jgi:hypothetical protein
MVIGDTERDLVSGPGQADVGPEDNKDVSGDAAAFARRTNAYDPVRDPRTR